MPTTAGGSWPDEGFSHDSTKTVLFDAGHLHHLTFRQVEILYRLAGFHLLSVSVSADCSVAYAQHLAFSVSGAGMRLGHFSGKQVKAHYQCAVFVFDLTNKTGYSWPLVDRRAAQDERSPRKRRGGRDSPIAPQAPAVDAPIWLFQTAFPARHSPPHKDANSPRQVDRWQADLSPDIRQAEANVLAEIEVRLAANRTVEPIESLLVRPVRLAPQWRRDKK